MSRTAGRQNSNQLATLTAHATQLQARLLVALDTLDAQNLAHASELAALQESYDKLAARARRLEYERNAANDDLAEMTAVLELVIEKVSAANDYKVLAHSDLRLPMPLSPPRTRSGARSNRSTAKSDTPSDESAYTAALVSALTAQLDAARAQATRERSESERKIARLEAMVELRDVEIKRNLRRSVNSVEGNSFASDASGSEGRTGTPGMSRGEAIAAYENIAKDNERLEKEVVRLKSELASAEFNRATSEIGTSSSWAKLPEWARPQPQSQPVASSSKPTKRPSSRQTQPSAQSESSDRAPSSLSEPHPSPVPKPTLLREDSSASDPTSYRPSPQPSRTRSSASTSDPHRLRSRSSRHTATATVTVSDTNTEDSRERVEAITAPRPLRRSNLRDSGIGVDSGSEATGTRTRVKAGTREHRRRTPDTEQPAQPQQEHDTTSNSVARGQDLMPLLPALTPSKVRAPRVEVVELPSTSYIEPSFGISLRKKSRPGREERSDGADSRESSRTSNSNRISPALLEPPRTATLGPTPSPRTISPVGEFLLPPSVVSREDGPVQVMSTTPTRSPPVHVQSPPLLELSPLQPPPVLQPPAALQSPPTLQPAPVILQPSPLLHSTIQQTHQQQRSRSSSRTARLSPLPVFDFTGLPAYETLTGTSSAPVTKTAEPVAEDVADSPIRRQSDPAPTTQTEPPPLVRQRSNSAAPSTPPRSTNNTVQFAFITPVHENIYGGDGAGATTGGEAPTNGASMAAEAGTTIAGLGTTTLGGNLTTAATITETVPNPGGNTSNTTGRRRLLPLFKFMSPSPGTPPSTKKRRAMTAPSQLSNSTGPDAISPVQGISASPLARGRPVRESPLQLVLGSTHAAKRAEMRVPVMREVGSSGGRVVTSLVPGGLVPPIVPSAPLNALVAPLVSKDPLPTLNIPPGTSLETQNVLRGMQAERALLDRAQAQGPVQQEITPENMAHVLHIEAECLRLRRDSSETAALRREIELLRAQLRERDQGLTRSERESIDQDQDYTTTTISTDVVSESVETYSEDGGDSDDTAPTATEATLPEGHVSLDSSRRGFEDVEQELRDASAELDAKDRAVAELRMRMDDMHD